MRQKRRTTDEPLEGIKVQLRITSPPYKTHCRIHSSSGASYASNGSQQTRVRTDGGLVVCWSCTQTTRWRLPRMQFERCFIFYKARCNASRGPRGFGLSKLRVGTQAHLKDGCFVRWPTSLLLSLKESQSLVTSQSRGRCGTVARFFAGGNEI